VPRRLDQPRRPVFGRYAVGVDAISLDLLAGAEVDFVEDLMGASFRINNPNAASPAAAATPSRSVGQHFPHGRTANI